MNTIRIALVDDNPKVNFSTKKSIEKLRKLNKFEEVNFEITEFNCGEVFLVQAINFHIVILDYEMPKMDGIEVGNELEKRKIDIKIIYYSGYDDLLVPLKKSTFNSLTAGFIFKSEKEDVMLNHVSNVSMKLIDVELISINHYEEEVKCDSDDYRKVYYESVIDANKITTIESNKKEIFVYLDDGTELLTDITLKEWLVILDPARFAQCNRKCIVNLKYIAYFSTRKIIFCTGEEIILSDKNKKNVKKNWAKYKVKEGNKVC